VNPTTIALLLQLIALAGQLAPEVLRQIEGIKQQTSKTAEEIFKDAGVTIDANDVKALAILAQLMAPAETPDDEASA